MSKLNPQLLIGDIIESGLKILQYTENLTFEDFVQDSKTVDAVIRNFEIIGEAANRLPDDFKDLRTDIDWHRIRGIQKPDCSRLFWHRLFDCLGSQDFIFARFDQ